MKDGLSFSRGIVFHRGRNVCDTLGCGRYAANLTENREIYIPHLYFTPPQWRPRWNFAKTFSTGKTRMIGLDRHRQTDGRTTDRQTDDVQNCYINTAHRQRAIKIMKETKTKYRGENVKQPWHP